MATLINIGNNIKVNPKFISYFEGLEIVLANKHRYTVSADVIELVKAYVENRNTGALHYKGKVSSVSNLPSTGNIDGDMYLVTGEDKYYAWNGTTWDDTPTIVNISSLESSLSSEVSRAQAKEAELQEAIDDQNGEIADFKEAITDQVNNYQPVVIEGDVTNAADEEDLTSENGLLKIKNRSALNGMGYIILRRGSSFASQVVLSNTIYEIRYNFDLGGAEVTVPSNCVLKFEGGSISNAVVKTLGARIERGQFNNAYIQAKGSLELYDCQFNNPNQKHCVYKAIEAGADFSKFIASNCRFNNIGTSIAGAGEYMSAIRLEQVTDPIIENCEFNGIGNTQETTTFISYIMIGVQSSGNTSITEPIRNVTIKNCSFKDVSSVRIPGDDVVAPGEIHHLLVYYCDGVNVIGNNFDCSLIGAEGDNDISFSNEWLYFKSDNINVENNTIKGFGGGEGVVCIKPNKTPDGVSLSRANILNNTFDGYFQNCVMLYGIGRVCGNYFNNSYSGYVICAGDRQAIAGQTYKDVLEFADNRIIINVADKNISVENMSQQRTAIYFYTFADNNIQVLFQNNTIDVVSAISTSLITLRDFKSSVFDMRNCQINNHSRDLQRLLYDQFVGQLEQDRANTSIVISDCNITNWVILYETTIGSFATGAHDYLTVSIKNSRLKRADINTNVHFIRYAINKDKSKAYLIFDNNVFENDSYGTIAIMRGATFENLVVTNNRFTGTSMPWMFQTCKCKNVEISGNVKEGAHPNIYTNDTANTDTVKLKFTNNVVYSSVSAPLIKDVTELEASNNVIYGNNSDSAAFVATTKKVRNNFFPSVPEKAVKGDTSSRPTLQASDAGFQYFDSDLGKPIYWTGSKWVDATGADLT